MNTDAVAAISGGLVGLGTFLAIRALLPPAPPDLAAALARWTAPTGPEQPRESTNPLWAERPLRWLSTRTARRTGALLGAPTRDLELLSKTVEWFVIQRIMSAFLGLALPAVLWAFLAVLGLSLPFVLPTVLGLAAGVTLSLIPALSVKEQAQRARAEFGRATSAYLDLVAQERASGRSPTQALLEAAEIGQGWVFARIRQTLVHAPRVGITPWQGLAQLGERVGVPELIDLADIVASAADGAAVYTTLTKKAAALRATALSQDQAAANAASEKLSLPVALLGAGFVLILFYPAFVNLVEAGG